MSHEDGIDLANDQVRPFRDAYEVYRDLGFVCIPCGGENRKTPRCRWAKFQNQRPGHKEYNRWQGGYGRDNISLVTGPISSLTVIDCDNPDVSVAQLEGQFGASNYIVRTPRGGIHLYYSYSGEKTAAGVYPGIDVRGGGGLIVAPPSIGINGNPYAVIKGTNRDLRCLTPVKPSSLPSHVSIEGGQAGKVQRGERNQWLFSRVKEIAVVSAETQDELLTEAYALNNLLCDTPLPTAEVEAMVAQVWRYKQEQRLFGKGEGRLYIISPSAFEVLSISPRALTLYLLLRRAHQDIREKFCIAQSQTAIRLKWADKRTVASAISDLVEKGIIEVLHPGGSGPGDVAWYRFTKGAF